MSTNYTIDSEYRVEKVDSIIPPESYRDIKVCEICNKLMLNVFGQQNLVDQKPTYYCSKWCWSKRHIRSNVD